MTYSDNGKPSVPQGDMSLLPYAAVVGAAKFQRFKSSSKTPTVGCRLSVNHSYYSAHILKNVFLIPVRSASAKAASY